MAKTITVNVRKKQGLWKTLKRYKWLYIMLIPAAIFYIIFKLYPASYLIIIFQDYFPTLGVTGSPWVGLYNFERMFEGSAVYSFGLLFTNTIMLALYNLIFYFPIPIILSLLLNEIKRSAYKRVVQSLIYLPHFLSWSVLVGLVYLFIGPTGYINKMADLHGRAADPVPAQSELVSASDRHRDHLERGRMGHDHLSGGIIGCG